MPRPKGSKNRAKVVSLPQIGRTTEFCVNAQERLNEFGLLGYRLLSVVLNGANNRDANAVFTATNQKWQYKIIQFSMRDPKVAEDTVNRIGEEGWIFHQVYSQGSNMFATALVLIRPAGQLDDTDAGPVQSFSAGKSAERIETEQTESDASETSDSFLGTESNVTKESLAPVG